MNTEKSNSFVTIEKASDMADIILQRMPVDELIPWSVWWEQYVVPCDTDPCMDIEIHRHAIKKLINDEFEARKKANRLFVDPKKGVFMLNGDTAVAAKFFLDRAKKVGNSVRTTIDKCRDLATADGLSYADSRMLENASGTIDGNFTTLAGAIARMRSLPRNVKLLALRYLDAGIDEN